jgi:hypothetical protein
MSETDERHTMDGLPRHARALLEAVDSLVGGLGVLQAVNETLSPASSNMDWTIAKLSSDVTRIEDLAQRVEMATRRVGAA